MVRPHIFAVLASLPFGWLACGGAGASTLPGSPPRDAGVIVDGAATGDAGLTFPEDAGTAPDGGALTTHRVTLASQEGPYFDPPNSSIVVRPFLSPTDLAGQQGTDFADVYNRLPCQVGDDDRLANQGFAGHALERYASARPIYLSTITIDSPDVPSTSTSQGHSHASDACYAFRTSDGIWHGHYAPATTSYDAAANVWRCTFRVDAENVDTLGVIAWAPVSAVAFTARPE